MTPRRSCYALLLLLFISFSGCSVFSPIGDAIGKGYENTVAYFNSYYNAQRLFGEAVDEILAHEESDRGRRGFSAQPLQPPPSARQKLTLVIDKASNILAFHPSSALVDDALLLIGQSYFYQGDYLKAERKFVELLSGFPETSLALEAQLWYVKTLARLKKDDEALESAARVLTVALDEGEEDVAAEIQFVRGEIFSSQEAQDRAIAAYRESAQRSSDDVLISTALYRIADLQFRSGDFAQAAAAFRDAEESAEEPGIVVASRLQEIRSLRAAGQYEEAIQRCDESREDFRFGSREKEILFERGLTYAAEGSHELALQELIFVDTSQVKTELGCRAAFEVARLYEQDLGDYRSAHQAYIRASAFPVPEIYAAARKRDAAFTRYFELVKKQTRRDSLLALPASASDSIRPDSAFLVLSPQMIDSLEAERRETLYQMAELFSSELEDPDSAVFYYRAALESVRDSTRVPRILFVLAELASSYPERGFGVQEDYFKQILSEYPRSVYAMRAKVQLGIPVEEAAVDSGSIQYRNAESLIDSGRIREAIAALKRIVREYPESPYAPKSEYAIGYLFEHYLSRPDSALMRYRSLVETYGASPYAQAVRERIRPESPADTIGVQKKQRDDLPIQEQRGDDRETPVSGQPATRRRE